MRIRLTSALGAALLLSAAPALAGTIVVPNSFANVEGDSFSRLGFATTAQTRYQQVFGASQFGSGPVTLTGFALRANALAPSSFFNIPGTAFSSTIEGMISLSTTSRAPDALSTTFAANVGADVVAVIPRGTITYSSTAAGPANGPRVFDVIFTFANPFTYDPTRGNLLLDFSKFSSEFPTPIGTAFDSTNVLGDSVSYLLSGTSSSSATGVQGTDGYVVQFQTANATGAVPEPATWAMMLLGFGAIGGMLRRRAGTTQVRIRYT